MVLTSLNASSCWPAQDCNNKNKKLMVNGVFLTSSAYEKNR